MRIAQVLTLCCKRGNEFVTKVSQTDFLNTNLPICDTHTHTPVAITMVTRPSDNKIRFYFLLSISVLCHVTCIQSANSPCDSAGKKIRRKLPPVPQEKESPPPPKSKASGSNSRAPKVDKVNQDKELLRKRLQEKEAAQRRRTKSVDAIREPVKSVESRKPSGKSGPPVPAKPAAISRKVDKESQTKQLARTGSPKDSNGSSSSESAKTLRTESPKNGQQPVKKASVEAAKKGVTAKGGISTSTVGTNTTGTDTVAKPAVMPKPKPVVEVKKSSVAEKVRLLEGAIPTAPEPAKKEEETVNIRGIVVPLDIKFLKQRIKEEVQIVTATRRLKIDELEEIRVMERELAEREKERKIKAEKEAVEYAKMKAEKERLKREQEKQEALERKEQELAERERQLAEQKAAFERSKLDLRRKVNMPVSSATLATVRMSPQASPRRFRHKRQNSDPMVAKFSPIEEVRDIENDMQYKLGLEARRVTAELGRFSPQPLRAAAGRRFGSISPPPRTAELEDIAFNQRRLYASPLSRSSEALTKYSLVERDTRLTNSQSESDISLTALRGRNYFPDADDKQRLEEKKYKLQMEIAKRRMNMEDNARLQHELRQLSESNSISQAEMELARARYQQYMRSRVPTGIIKPIDYERELLDADEFFLPSYESYLLEKIQQGQFHDDYPDFRSPEYMGYPPQGAHPGYATTDATGKPLQHDVTGMVPHWTGGDYDVMDYYSSAQDGRMVASPGDPYADVYPPDFQQQQQQQQGDTLKSHRGGSSVVPGLGAGVYPYGIPTSSSANRDSGTSRAVGPADPYALRLDGGEPQDPQSVVAPQMAPPVVPAPEGVSDPAVPSNNHLLDTSTPNSEPLAPNRTPAMPILDDVTRRSRSLLRDIGSRPLSDDLEKYFHAQGIITFCCCNIACRNPATTSGLPVWAASSWMANRLSLEVLRAPIIDASRELCCE